MANLPSVFQKGPLGRLLRNPLTQRMVRNSGYLFGGSTLSAAMSMVQGVLAARLLVLVEGPEAGVVAFGVLGIVTDFASVINRLTSFRMGELVVNFVGEYSAQGQRQHAAAAFKAAALAEVGSSILAFGLITLLSSIAARYLVHDPSRAGLFAVYGGLLVLGNLIAESSTGLLQYFDQFRTQAALMLGQSAVTLVLIGVAFVTRGGLVAVVFAYLVGKVMGALSITAAALRQAGRQWGVGWWRAPLSLLSERRRAMARFALSTNLTATLTLITRDSELLWLGALSTPLQVGYYKVTRAIVNILLIPIQPLISTTFREVAREVASRRWENVRYLLRSGSLISAAYSSAASLGLVVLGRWVVAIYGAEFLPTAYQSLLVLLAGLTVVNIFYWNRTVLLPLGLPEYPTKVTLVAAVLKVGAMFWLVPRLGAVGMAITLSAFFLGTAVVLVWKTVREIRYQAQTSPVVAPG